MPILSSLFFLLFAAATGADTLLLKDGTRATVGVVDTHGCCIVVKHGDDCVQIDKKNLTSWVASADSARSDNQNTKDTFCKTPLSVNKAIENVLAGFAAKQTVLSKGGMIAFQKLPIAGNDGDERACAEFSKKMASFLTKRGPVRYVSKEGMYFCLSGAAVYNDACRYLALPYEISVLSNERKMNVSSFVKLDKAGNFVPTTKGTTLKALERKTIVRFMIIDLLKKTIAFDERVEDIDKGFKELDAKNANDSQNVAGKNSILVVESKFEELLKKQFK